MLVQANCIFLFAMKSIIFCVDLDLYSYIGKSVT